MKKILLLSTVLLFTVILSTALLAQEETQQNLLTEDEIITYNQNVEKIINLYNPELVETTLKELNMTFERFEYVDSKISTFVMQEEKIEDIEKKVHYSSVATEEEKIILLKHKDEILKANKKLVELLKQRVEE